IGLKLEAGKLKISAPRGVVTPELTARLSAEREGILALLESTQNTRASAETLPKAASTEALPLTPAQRQLWLLDQLAPGTATLNVPLALRLRGHLDRQAMAAAVRSLGQRHDALRLEL